MPRKQTLDQSYLTWANDLPEDIRAAIVEKFLSSAGAEKIAQYDTQQSRYGELENWAQQHQDLYQALPQWANFMRQHKLDDVERSLSGARREIEQQASEVIDAADAGALPYEQAVTQLRRLDKQYTAITSQVSEFKKFREEEFPQLVGAAEKNFDALYKGQLANNRMLIQYFSGLVDYINEHKDRRAEKIAETFMNGDGKQYKTFADIANDAYGTEDTEQRVEQRAAQMAEQQKTTGSNTSSEPPISGSALGPFRRQTRTVTAPPPTTESGMRERLLEHFQKVA